jgi:hypothetical protein
MKLFHTRTPGSQICDEIQRLTPAITTREGAVDKRGNLLYIDDSQNELKFVKAIEPSRQQSDFSLSRWEPENNPLSNGAKN